MAPRSRARLPNVGATSRGLAWPPVAQKVPPRTRGGERGHQRPEAGALDRLERDPRLALPVGERADARQVVLGLGDAEVARALVLEIGVQAACRDLPTARAPRARAASPAAPDPAVSRLPRSCRRPRGRSGRSRAGARRRPARRESRHRTRRRSHRPRSRRHGRDRSRGTRGLHGWFNGQALGYERGPGVSIGPPTRVAPPE